MSLTTLHPGLAYGAGTASEDLKAGEFVKLTGADLFSKVTDAADIVFGVTYRDSKTGDYVTIYTQGGVYETENFVTGIAAGDELEIDVATAGLKKKAALSTAATVAIAISATATELKFKLVI